MTITIANTIIMRSGFVMKYNQEGPCAQDETIRSRIFNWTLLGCIREEVAVPPDISALFEYTMIFRALYSGGGQLDERLKKK